MTQEDPTTRRDIIQEMQKKRNILLGNCSAERNKIFNLVAIRFGQNRWINHVTDPWRLFITCPNSSSITNFFSSFIDFYNIIMPKKAVGVKARLGSSLDTFCNELLWSNRIDWASVKRQGFLINWLENYITLWTVYLWENPNMLVILLIISYFLKNSTIIETELSEFYPKLIYCIDNFIWIQIWHNSQ